MTAAAMNLHRFPYHFLFRIAGNAVGFSSSDIIGGILHRRPIADKPALDCRTATRCPRALHVLDDVRAELRAFDLGGAFHQAGEIVGDALGADGAVEPLTMRSAASVQPR